MILNHIRILCNEQKNVGGPVSNYIIKWLAQMIQYPEQKTICPVLISKEGCGKGWLMKVIEIMIGEDKYFETTKPSWDCWGSFNEIMYKSFFVHLSEMGKWEVKDAEGEIKGLITDNELIINAKGKNQIKVNSYHWFIVCTNKNDPIQTSKDDRWKLIIWCSDALKGNYQYFDTFERDVIKNVDAIKTFFEYLRSKDNFPDMDKFGFIPLP